jgi:CheY-like chemotaxis protein
MSQHRVLLVEDDENIRQLVESILSKLGDRKSVV